MERSVRVATHSHAPTADLGHFPGTKSSPECLLEMELAHSEDLTHGSP